MRKWSFLLVLLLSLLGTHRVNASHLVGGFLTYEYLPPTAAGYNYRVTIFAYRDCSGSVEFDDAIGLCIYNNNKSFYKQVDIKILSRKKVDPVGNTACPELAKACLEQGIYQTTITVPASSTGYHLKWERCCRNTQTNLADQSGVAYQGQTYYGFIPPTSIKNSSPYFLDVPVPFICAGDTTTIRNRALDIDGDSLSYKLVTPWQGATAGLPEILNCNDPMTPFYVVDYKSGYSATTPFGNSGIASVDAFNGLTTYLSPNTGRYAVCVEVTEWRNGVAISTVRLDLQILVITCGKNEKPRLKYEGNTKVWNVEVGETICRDITGFDSKDTGQVVTLRAYGDILTGTNGYTGKKATLTPTVNANIKTVTSEFCWTPNCDINTTNPYRVTFEAFDNGCPSKFVNENVLIYVKPVTVTEKISGPILLCANTLGAKYDMSFSVASHTYKWEAVNGKIVGTDTGKSVVVDWGPDTTGVVRLRVFNRFGCEGKPVELPIKLLKAPDIPKVTGPDTVCLQQNFAKQLILPNGHSVQYTWNTAKLQNIGDNLVGNQYSMTFKPISGGNGAWLSYRLAKNVNSGGTPVTCYSPWDTSKVYVSTPVSSGVLGPQSVCPNNKGLIYNLDKKYPGAKYFWSATGQTANKVVNDTQFVVDWGGVGTGSIKVVVIDRFGCKDSSSISVVKNHSLAKPKIFGDTNLCALTNNEPYWVKGVQKENYTWQVVGGAFSGTNVGTTVKVNWGIAAAASIGVQASAYDSVSKLPCLSPWSTVKVLLQPAPTAPPVITINQCQTRSWVSYWKPTAAIPGEKIYPQISAPGLTFKLLPASDSSSWDIQFYGDTFGTFTVQYRLTSQWYCPGPFTTASISLKPRPRTSVISGPADVCVPNVNNIPYAVSGESGSSMEWWVSGGGFTNPPLPTDKQIFVSWLLSATPGRVRAVETSSDGCLGDTQSITVFVDNPSVVLNVVSVAPPPNADNSVWVNFSVLNAPRYNNAVFIQSRPAGLGNFVSVGSTSAASNQFIHTPVNTDVKAWEYRVAIVNRCGDTLFSNPHTLVLLNGQKTGPFSMAHTFSPYLGFANGVNRYELYRSFTNGNDYLLYQTYANPQSDNFDNGKDNYAQYFRIKAIEQGSGTESWSNDILINYEPVLFIPNAFTPNQKGGNETFIPFSGGLKTYKMSIFNRWGEKLFETANMTEGWDGTVLGDPAMQGIYVYVIEYSDYQNKQYTTQGTLQLLR